MSYDPNDPNRPKPGVDHKETYVEPVERKSSALPLIIGVLLALALAYFVLQRFMADDTTIVEGDTTTVTTTEDAPEIVEAPAVVAVPDAEPDAVEIEAEAAADNAAADAEAAAESAAEAADEAAAATGTAIEDTVDNAGEAASDAADAAADAAGNAADAIDDAVTIDEPAAEVEAPEAVIVETPEVEAEAGAEAETEMETTTTTVPIEPLTEESAVEAPATEEATPVPAN